MPELKKRVAQTVKVFLPSTKDEEEENKAFVVLDVSPALAGEVKEYDAGKTTGELTMLSVMSKVVDWNYTDENGQKLKINQENFELIDFDDYVHIKLQLEEQRAKIEAARRMSPEQKKT